MDLRHLILIGAVGLGLSSCGDETPTHGAEGSNTNKDTTLLDRTEKIENIFFNIPSPIETVNILKKSGASYEWNLPLDPMKLDQFTGVTSKALALGIYGADLNYASVFEEENDMYMFLSCAEKLGNDLGVGQVFSKETTDRIEMNVGEKDSMQSIISETFWSIDTQLHEDGRESVSALIICGGWIEGVYLATQLAVLNPNNDEIKQRIAEQKFSIENLVKLMETYASSSAEEEILNSLVELEALFSQISEEKTPSTGGTDEDGMPIIGQQIVLTMSDDLLKDITQLVSEIRVDFTN